MDKESWSENALRANWYALMVSIVTEKTPDQAMGALKIRPKSDNRIDITDEDKEMFKRIIGNKKDSRTPKPVMVTNTQTGEKKYFKNRVLAAEELGCNAQTITNLVQSGRLLRKTYKIDQCNI